MEWSRLDNDGIQHLHLSEAMSVFSNPDRDPIHFQVIKWKQMNKLVSCDIGDDGFCLWHDLLLCIVNCPQVYVCEMSYQLSHCEMIY